MFDIEIHLSNRPGELAQLGETLGAAGISVEGGGMWLVGGTDTAEAAKAEEAVREPVGVAHFLVADGERATAALLAAGLSVTGCRPMLIQRLRQDEPGQLGTFCRAMADAGVNIEVLYSDHDNQLVVAVDDPEAGRAVSDAWMSR